MGWVITRIDDFFIGNLNLVISYQCDNPFRFRLNFYDSHNAEVINWLHISGVRKWGRAKAVIPQNAMQMIQKNFNTNIIILVVVFIKGVVNEITLLPL